uniref:non-specific serine/threonine protein kinase n=1 Tax=Leersia perrieri TaxID=77586 RepID=A0A0D9VCD6_9ORYZ
MLHHNARAPLLLLAIFLLFAGASPAISCTAQDSRSLLRFLAGLSHSGGRLAASWRPGTDCRHGGGWEGVTCDENGTVTEVSLPSRGLHGRISSSLADMAGLTRLNLSHNALSGDLPSNLISSMTTLLVLDVSFNNLDGFRPPPSSLITNNLQVLDISSNKFAGELLLLSSPIWNPYAMGNLIALNASNNSFTGLMPAATLCRASPSLSVLDLSYNKFTGEISPAIAGCSMLKVFMAGYNKLSGTLPIELFNMRSLEHISFTNNGGLEGELDGSHIAKLSNLVTLDLGWNSFSGEIPESIGQLKKLEVLRLSNNTMSGDLPSSLSNCTRLTVIDLKINNFSGDLHKVDFSAMHNLKTLDLLCNNFSGTIPESIYSCSNLIALRFATNHIHGEISSRIGDLKHLSFLSLTENSFTNIAKVFHALKSSKNIVSLFIGQNFLNEAIPETIDGFENLQHLAMQECSLTGKIPLWISKLKNLKVLDLSGNRLTGSIPSWISSLNNLFYLDVSNNNLTGQIPVTLMEMPMLKLDDIEPYLSRPFDLPLYRIKLMRQYRALTSFPALFNLSTNNFTGMILPEIGMLKALTELDFSRNKLLGEIPLSICNLTKLHVLDLSSNHLTGPIPSALSKLNFLAKFNISNNDLEGTVPTGGQMSTFSNSSFDGNPKLCGSVLAKNCDSSVKAAPTVPAISEKEFSNKAIFGIAFGVFFGIGVLYDQLVFSRYFG